MKRNQDIRDYIRDSKICNWQVAEQLEISDNSFYMLLRKKLSEAERERIMEAIEVLKQEQQTIIADQLKTV
jgi:predicted XRE-type DNA-binding protein